MKSKIEITIEADLWTGNHIDGVTFSLAMRQFTNQHLAPMLEKFGQMDGPLQVAVLLEAHVEVPAPEDESIAEMAFRAAAQSAADYFAAVQSGAKDCDCDSCRAVRRGMAIMGKAEVDRFIAWLRAGGTHDTMPASAGPLMEILRHRQRQAMQERKTEELINWN